ncbi:hypothetical protein M407DRAFT_241177 [Tulasnella calospora MUT 4182]|uniref:MARVEL domain-containing protein n=1 Tax=Tulasnella calospora MUT 4182 TaxID=1051891 RepID=A0A0C3QUR7_9AGAM|nr:hypothetical protein M407DRAFT_241177 [Tulasnella calospora MUT 4182]
MNTTTAPPATTARGAHMGGAATGPGTGYGKRGIRRYHPILFGLISAIAIALIGLTAWMHHQYSASGLGGTSLTRRLDFLIFLACWTALFAAAYIIFAHTGRFGAIGSHASHVFWLLITWIMWLIGAALYQHRMSQLGCGLTHKMCLINRAIKALSWIEFALCFITMLIIILHIGGKTARYRTGPYDDHVV